MSNPVPYASGLTRREFVAGTMASGAGACTSMLAQPAPDRDEVLYNGIRLPSTWPPRNRDLSLDPVPPPYLVTPPRVIPIDIGRQLFVDDFLIADTTLQRIFHLAEYHPLNPVLKPDKPWEMTGENPTAMVFSDGVWFDPRDRLFKIWYMGGYTRSTCYATSKDGIQWEKPALDMKPGTNIVQADTRDSTTIWLDHGASDRSRRFVMSLAHKIKDEWRLSIFRSADGIHWGEPVINTAQNGDRTTIFWNPFRKVWVYSLRDGFMGGRSRRYWENRDIVTGPLWSRREDSAAWIGADRLDPMRDDLKTQCQLYNLDCVAYESLIIGLFSIWRGQPRDRAKPNEVCIGFSRDGFHWHRPDRRAFIPVSERYGDWNWGNVQSAGGCCLVVGDKLYFYVSGRAGVRGTTQSGVSTTGLATLRRDGFASMDAGQEGGTLTTRPVKFRGKYCFVNFAGTGHLAMEILDESGKTLRGYSYQDFHPVGGDDTRLAARWNKAPDLSRLAGRTVRFRFYLQRGKLFAFWVTDSKSGASNGYVAAGGPGFKGPADVT